jgi:DNA-binding PadR family transcriptional regulator
MPETEVLLFLESHNGWVTDNNLDGIATLHYGTDGGGYLAGPQIDYQIFLDLKKKGFVDTDDTRMPPRRRYKTTDAGREHLKSKTETP